MPTVVLQFTCPRTGRSVEYTETEDLEALKGRWDRKLRRICPHCGARHVFRFRDGVMNYGESYFVAKKVLPILKGPRGR
jgi:ribosomal protein S27AE